MLTTAAYAPVGVAFDKSGKTAYAWYGQYYGSSGAQLDIIDVTRGQIVSAIAANGCGGDIVLTPKELTAVAADACNNELLVFSLRSQKIRSTISLSGLNQPTGLALDSTGKTAYVAGNSGLAIVDIPHAHETANVALPSGICWQQSITGVALVEKARRAYAAICGQSGGNPVIAVIDTRTHKMLKMIAVGSGKEWPIAVVASSLHPYVYVSVENADGVTGQIVAIDTRSNIVTKTEYLHWAPLALAMSPNESAVFATTWEGAIWYNVGPHGLKGTEQGPVCCSAADSGFGAFVH